ncbi:uncharacterized protein LTR77_000048 [Saxophila tyrrhenica]|uniref:BTB domain-containing protein n=1 Tax=Saxophila tyrrhenica TaxID=1690608 RepID=A0AAV9PQ28_9PEZI|nr:hypothetical protein LTR77_000048 [Saxophila tyrrhenica]
MEVSHYHSRTTSNLLINRSNCRNTDHARRRTDKFSDIVIKSGDLEFKCHKVILSFASGYFASLLDLGFKESTQDVIELKEDSPRAVAAILRYIYTFDYGSIPDTHSAESTAKFHLDVHAAANKYGLPRLAEKALAKLDQHITTIDTPAADKEAKAALLHFYKRLLQ